MKLITFHGALSSAAVINLLTEFSAEENQKGHQPPKPNWATYRSVSFTQTPRGANAIKQRGERTRGVIK
jgi:hypothetical protein